MNALLRDSGEQFLRLIAGIADRTGEPGTVKAARRRDELRAALGDGDEDRVKREIRGIISHVGKKDYATDEEFGRAQELAETLPDDLLAEIKTDLEGHKGGRVQKKRLTIAELESYLDARCVRVRRNLITHQVELEGWNREGIYSEELQAEQFPVILHDELADGYTGCKEDEIARMVAVIAGKNEHNPVLDLLRAGTWDGIDRFPELYKILGVSDALSQMLVSKWMRQAVAMQYNSISASFGGEGVLVLAGPQGCGKSEFARRIAELTGADGLFLPGALLDPADKDSVIQATSRWIVEIGELGATFSKADMGRLKAFLTKGFDTYRVPFERQPISVLRRTSFIATVDRADFLTDDSGNRRWWVVKVDRIDLDALDKLDKVQLWRQVLSLIDREGAQSFRLTRDERDILNKSNKKHETLIASEQELRDILAEYRGDVETVRTFELKHMSASQIIAAYGLKYDAKLVGKALKKIGIEWGTLNGTVWYNFPDRKFTSTSANG